MKRLVPHLLRSVHVNSLLFIGVSKIEVWYRVGSLKFHPKGLLSNAYIELIQFVTDHEL